MVLRIEDIEDTHSDCVSKVQLSVLIVVHVNNFLKFYNMEVNSINIQVTCYNFFFSYKEIDRVEAQTGYKLLEVL